MPVPNASEQSRPLEEKRARPVNGRERDSDGLISLEGRRGMIDEATADATVAWAFSVSSARHADDWV